MSGAGRAAPTAVLGAQSAREVRVGGVPCRHSAATPASLMSGTHGPAKGGGRQRLCLPPRPGGTARGRGPLDPLIDALCSFLPASRPPLPRRRPPHLGCFAWRCHSGAGRARRVPFAPLAGVAVGGRQLALRSVWWHPIRDGWAARAARPFVPACSRTSTATPAWRWSGRRVCLPI